MATVEFVDVEKTYESGVRAVHPFRLTVADGEFMVLVGPSGCGKSTILRMVAGLETPTAGVIRIGGQDVTAFSPQDRNVAMVFQDYALYPHKTVRGNLEFPLRMMRMDRAEIGRRVERAAALLGLGEMLDRKPRALSGGQRQRVAMGRAIVRDPQAFLMDEPLSNLDAKLRTEVRGEIARLQAELGVTTIYVTHDQVEAMTLGHRIAVIMNGRLMQVGPAEELYERPGDVWVGAFLGSPPLNLLRARLEAEGSGGRVVLGDQELILDAGGLPGAGPASGSREVLIGLRPEAFSPAGEGDRGRTLRLVVRKAERLGHETILYLGSPAATVLPRSDGTGIDFVEDGSSAEIAARVPAGAEYRVGGEIALAVDTGALRIFTVDGTAASP